MNLIIAVLITDITQLQREAVDQAMVNQVEKVKKRNQIKGKDPATKSDEFLEKIQTAFDPPLIFGKLYCKFL